MTYLITDNDPIGNTSLSGLLGKEQQMPWFKVDDGFTSSPKVISIPRSIRLTAIGAWTSAGNYAAKNLTDGFVPNFYLDEIGLEQPILEALIRSGLWDWVEDGIQFHDWCEYQPSAKEYKATREARSKAGSVGGQRSAQAKLKQTSSKSEAKVNPEPEPEPEPFTSNEVNHLSDFEIRVFDECFEEFWSWYPRKTGKGAARKAYAKALKKINHIALCHAANRLASDPNLPETQFIPHPSTWLNEERWDDEPYAPRGKANIKEIQQREASEKFLASFTEQPAITANPEWA